MEKRLLDRLDEIAGQRAQPNATARKRVKPANARRGKKAAVSGKTGERKGGNHDRTV
jgi:hypothetical protein